MPVKLYTCSNMWVKVGGHPCHRVRSALDAQGIEYELVKGPVSRGTRNDLEALSGQRLYPVIQFEDGTVYREQSKDMAARIRAGTLLEAPRREPGSAHGHDHAHEHGHDHEHE
jgi:hypothetical protein